MEIHLDRRMSEKRVYPSINVNRSAPAARNCCSAEILQKVWILRKLLYGMDDIEAWNSCSTSQGPKSNGEFFDAMPGADAPACDYQGVSG